MPDNCFICFSQDNLKKERLTWKMIDGTIIHADIYKCQNCLDFEKDIQKKETEEWIKETIKKITKNDMEVRGEL